MTYDLYSCHVTRRWKVIGLRQAKLHSDCLGGLVHRKHPHSDSLTLARY